MSLMRMWGVRSLFASFAEMLFFFGVFTPLYVLGLTFLAAGLASGFGEASFWGSIFLAPLWSQLLIGSLYLVVVLSYWSPGDQQDCEAELRGFALFLVVAVIVLTVVLNATYGVLASIGEPLWEVYGEPFSKLVGLG